MTITTGTTVLALGDKVRILDGAHRAGYSTSISRHVGKVAEVMSSEPDSDGDIYVKVETGEHVFFLPQFLQKVTPEAAPEKVEQMEAGQRYEITQDMGGHGFQPGAIVRALKQNGSASTSWYCTTRDDVAVGEEPTFRSGQTAWVNVTDVKPVLAEWERELLGMTPAAPTSEDEAALAQARAEAEAAVKALEEFKAEVREQLIAESYRQGSAWIESIDSWLDELGLESQYDGMPTTMRTVVLLKGNRVATLLEKGESRPWEVKQLSDEGARYVRFFSYQEIKESFVAVLVDGPDEDDDFRDE